LRVSEKQKKIDYKIMKIDFKNYISINLLDERPLKKNPIGLTALPTQKISTLVNPIG
jgi:hypothetical protein